MAARPAHGRALAAAWLGAVGGGDTAQDCAFNEAWEYWRSTGVTIEFNRYGKRIYMKRSGRQLGDTAFATKGSLLRTATGFHQIFIPPGCHSFTLVDPSCGQKVKAPLDMRLDWGGGKLRIKHSGPAGSMPTVQPACE